MAFISVTFKSEEIRAFAANLRRFKSTVNSYMFESFEYVLDVLHAGSPVDTGEFMLGWDEKKRQDGGMSFANPTFYGPKLEDGGYTRESDKVVKTARGYFSRQAPYGVIQPIIDDPEKYNIDKAADEMIGKVMLKLGMA